VRAASGEEALKRLLDDDYALILMDVQMPGLDGFETAEHIKRRERTSHIPIIFITALSKDAHHAFRGYSVGAVDFLLKPFDAEVLRAKVAVFVDLYRLKHEAERQAHRALHDALTGLPNRVLFMDRLEVALARVERRTARITVVFLDLDGFKRVNDSRGHEAGDELLVQAAERLRAGLRPADTVARFGGDEFAVMAEVEDEKHVLDLAGRLLEELERPFELVSGEASISASIGIALAHDAKDDPPTLLREADAAMYRSKREGGASLEIFDGDMRRRAAKRLKLEDALRLGIAQNELRLLYQPDFDLATGVITGVEALVRWERPGHGLVAPAEFLPVAEESDLIVALGAWVLDEALGQRARWAGEDPQSASLRISVNLSAKQLSSPGLVEMVSGALARTATDPRLLCLEISEGAIDESRARLACLERLHALGVRFALDDFGTGLSSLGYLTRLKVDILKIDPSLISVLAERPEGTSVASAIVGLAHALELTSVAEGIETREQLEQLRVLGCDLGQGSFLSEPRDAAEISTLLVADRGLIDLEGRMPVAQEA